MATIEEKILTLEQAQCVRQAARENGQRVVQCHGCFDIVHPGHLRYLRFAKSQGHILFVSVTSDRFVGKGVDRPFVGEALRAESLAALETVDYVLVDDHDWAGPVLNALQPDVYVKGREYESKEDVRFARERALVEAYGGSVVFGSGEVVYSSTEIIERWSTRFGGVGERLASYCQRHRIGQESIAQAIRGFRDRRMLVIGDAIFDHYIYCHVVGAAEEAPMLSLQASDEQWFVGAAALVACQLAHLGARAGILTCYESSELADRWQADLHQRGVKVHHVESFGRPVYEKERYVVDDRKVLKVNRGRHAPLSTQAMEAFRKTFERIIADYEGVVLLDFGYGMFGPSVMRSISEITSRHKIPLYADVSGSSGALLEFRNVQCATPNEKELRAAMSDHESGLSVLAGRYFQHTAAKYLVITLGARGVVAFERPEAGQERLASEYLPSLAQYAIDSIGAGDVLLAALALSQVANIPFAHGLYLGNALAALQVGRPGNEPQSLPALEDFLAARPELNRVDAEEATTVASPPIRQTG